MPSITLVNTDNTVESDSVGNTADGTDLSRVVGGNISDVNDRSLDLSNVVATETQVTFDYNDPIAGNQRFGTASFTLDSTPVEPIGLTASLTPNVPANPLAFKASLTPPAPQVGPIFPTITNTGNIVPRQNVQPYMIIDGRPGDREEIGLFPEWHSMYLSTGDLAMRDTIIQMADDLLPLPWTDFYAMVNKPWVTPPGLSYGFSHQPNAFFLPYILTNDANYLVPMEEKFKLVQQWQWRSSGENGPMPNPNNQLFWLNGRGLAWGLRDLAQLAYIQRELGTTTETYYIEALEKTRLDMIASQSLPVGVEFHVYGENRLANSYQWTSWMESFIGMVINHVINLGFSEWQPLAEWHFVHLQNRSGGIWPLKAVDTDHITYTSQAEMDAATWLTTHPFEGQAPHLEERVTIFDGLPDDELMPLLPVNGIPMTYSDRAAYARSWAAMAANNGVLGALAVYNRINDGIEARDVRDSYIGYKYYKAEIEVV